MISLLLITLIVLSFGSAPPSETRIPVYRYWASSVGDHFYTRTYSELESGNSVYSWEGIGFYLSEEKCENSVPLYRWYRGSPAYDHFYSTTAAEIGTVTSGTEGNYGYYSEGILGYCYQEAWKRDDMVPLYRYWKSSISDHFYTTSLAEIGAGLSVGEYGNYNYRYEGVQCYVFASASDTLEKELNEHPVNEEKRMNDMELYHGEHEQMGFNPIQNNNPLQWNYIIIGGIIAIITMAVIMMVWYRNKNKKERGYQMLV